MSALPPEAGIQDVRRDDRFVHNQTRWLARFAGLDERRQANHGSRENGGEAGCVRRPFSAGLQGRFVGLYWSGSIARY
jgi:hypothetical protein